MRQRHEYSLALAAFDDRHSPSPLAGLHLRAAQESDVNILAELMLEAYRGTIDYDDETLDEAVAEVESWRTGKWGWMARPDVSRLVFCSSQLVSACLVSDSKEKEQFFISFVMTHPGWKRQGAARLALAAVLSQLRLRGFPEVRTVITDGNIASERLFADMGFERLPASAHRG